MDNPEQQPKPAKKKRVYKLRKYGKPVKRSTTPKRNYDDERYTKLRKFVRRRDDHKCQFPGCNYRNTRNKKLEVHHILRWWDFPALRYDSRNAVCLCSDCHKKVTGKEEFYVKMFVQIVQAKGEQQCF